jgi:hypothetical protein
MDENLIVAFACESDEGHMSFINLESPLTMSDVSFEKDALIGGNVVMHYNWFKSITVCTKEVLAELQETLQIA